MIVTKYGVDFNVTETQNLNFWRDVYHVWENDTFNFLIKHLNKDKVFVDIGSWIGPISLVTSQYSKKCICFEPDELAYNEFSNNIKLNNRDNIILENAAVSIHKQIKLGATELGTSITREDCSENSKVYNCITVEEIFSKYQLSEQNVSVIKIDVEGHESELLQDKFLWNLNVPMHISLHPGWKSDKDKFYKDVLPFFEHKKVNIFNFNPREFFDVEVN
jgi:FkbM family methyltransferase